MASFKTFIPESKVVMATLEAVQKSSPNQGVVVSEGGRRGTRRVEVSRFEGGIFT